MTKSTLLRVVARVGAGALDDAWRLFVESGFADALDDPEAARVEGRLLKERAAREHGSKRENLYLRAAAAYKRGIHDGATYPLINAATLSLLGGDPAQAAAYARDVLTSLDAHPEEPETPYWRAATRAEALLLLDREAEAGAAFAEAIDLAPQAWEDHASTLRQFALILAEQGRDAAWLERHRPPRSLHFAGHMSFDARVGRRAHLDESIAAILEEEKVGFGYGALAAGADIIVAEALVARGAELHAVLPGGAEAFAAVSVDPFGRGWRRRFDALLKQAATVRAVAPVGIAPDREMVALGDEIAMGAAALNGRRLESEALRLVVRPKGEGDGAPSRASRWRERVVPAPRETAPAAERAPLPPAPHQRLALLTVAIDPIAGPEAAARAVAALPLPRLAPYFTGREIVFAYGSAHEAAAAALRLAAEGESGVGGHYGIADPVADPFGSGARITGDAAALAAGAAASAPAGTVCVTADFAAALAAARDGGIDSELVGELAAAGADPVALYALKPAPPRAAAAPPR
ncbi:MAG TPA: hypothetical protein VGC56_06715 [Allosphingosinicella sp.]